MGDSTTPQVRRNHGIWLEEINPNDPEDMQELTQQRLLCGWGAHDVPKWQGMMFKGDRLMYWLMQDTAKLSQRQNRSLNISRALRENCIGHIALDWVDYLGDDSLANRDEHRITATTLFVLPDRQGQGYGRTAMDLVEAKAKELGCRTITLNTMPSSYVKDTAWWASQGIAFDPLARAVPEEWYIRRGYREFKRVPRYPYKTLDGADHMMSCINMEKSL